MPNMMKKVQQIRTMFPIGRSEESKVWTTNFNPGARLMTLFVIGWLRMIQLNPPFLSDLK